MTVAKNGKGKMMIVAMIKSITTFLIVLMMIIMIYFVKGLKWKNEKDRASIIGFGFMQIVYIMSIISICI